MLRDKLKGELTAAAEVGTFGKYPDCRRDEESIELLTKRILRLVAEWGDKDCDIAAHNVVDAPRYFVTRQVPKRRECPDCWALLKEE